MCCRLLCAAYSSTKLLRPVRAARLAMQLPSQLSCVTASKGDSADRLLTWLKDTSSCCRLVLLDRGLSYGSER